MPHLFFWYYTPINFSLYFILNLYIHKFLICLGVNLISIILFLTHYKGYNMRVPSRGWYHVAPLWGNDVIRLESLLDDGEMFIAVVSFGRSHSVWPKGCSIEGFLITCSGFGYGKEDLKKKVKGGRSIFHFPLVCF